MVLLSNKFICIFYSFFIYFFNLNCIWDRKYLSLLLLWKLNSRTTHNLNDLHSLTSNTWQKNQIRVQTRQVATISWPVRSRRGRKLHNRCILFSDLFLPIVILPTHIMCSRLSNGIYITHYYVVFLFSTNFYISLKKIKKIQE